VTALAIVVSIAGALTAVPARAAADPNKVFRTYFPSAETGFDPARVSDIYSAAINEVIFERLLTYDYLARPAKLVPQIAETMPEVTDNGRTYTFHLRKGVFFTPDPAFKGVKRELVAQDFVYSLLRFFDPKLRSPYAFMIAGIVGVDELAAKATKTGKFDYDARMPGSRRWIGTRCGCASRTRTSISSSRSPTRPMVRSRARSSRPTARTPWRIRWAPDRTC
jgi:oligopeptide transport system substrate-binding protein